MHVCDYITHFTIGVDFAFDSKVDSYLSLALYLFHPHSFFLLFSITHLFQFISVLLSFHYASLISYHIISRDTYTFVVQMFYSTFFLKKKRIVFSLGGKLFYYSFDYPMLFISVCLFLKQNSVCSIKNTCNLTP